MFKIISVNGYDSSISSFEIEGIAKLLFELSSVRKGSKEEAFCFLRDRGGMSGVDGFKGVLWAFGDETRTPICIKGCHEIFSSILIYLLLKNSDINQEIIAVLRDVISHAQENGFFYFFDSKKSREILPLNVDLTSLGAVALLDIFKSDASSGKYPNITLDLLKSVAEKIVSNVLTQDVSFSSDILAQNVIQVYLPPRGERENRLDPVVCANSLYFLSELQNYCLKQYPDQKVDYLERAKSTEDFLYSVLEKGAYLKGTRYYSSPTEFLFFLTNMASTSEALKQRFYPLLKNAVKQLIGVTSSPLDLAMRVICARSLGVENEDEKTKLLDLQECDGGWPIDTFFTDEWMGIGFGSRALTTSFSLNAVGFSNIA